MHAHLSDEVVESFRLAARKLSGYERRQFQAEMALTYCDGNARQAERLFGWGRAAVETGLNEKRTGIRCLDGYKQRGRKKSEVTDPQLAADIRELVDPLTQSDPKFQTPLAFTRATAPAVQAALKQKLKGTGRKVPSRRTLVDMLNRLGYQLTRVQKTRPEKRSLKQTPSSRTSTPPTGGRPPTRTA